MYCLGIDIGGTKCAVLLGKVDADDPGHVRIERKRSMPTAGTPSRTIDGICAMIDETLREYGIEAASLTGIGISCGGPLDARTGRILNPPNLYGWNDVPIVDMLFDRYGVPATLDNDANACAVAEWKLGAGRGASNMVFLTFGTGLGAGLILDGRLYRGTNNMAGEVGHIRLSEFGPVGYGKMGSFEGFCSGGGIAQLARQKVRERLQLGERPQMCPTVQALDALTAKSVSEAAMSGDPLALEIFDVVGDYLGRGLSMLIDILNPELIVLGSIFYRSEHLLRAAMERALSRESLAVSRGVCRVVAAGLGEQIGDYAALSLSLVAE